MKHRYSVFGYSSSSAHFARIDYALSFAAKQANRRQERTCVVDNSTGVKTYIYPLMSRDMVSIPVEISGSDEPVNGWVESTRLCG